ncbi:uncharacterized protein An05g01160 [Aspergillus niger]|uniref:Arsenite methyltransferase n=2 Tax=Aspergillus niger TaxID=5061 RepID=A2QKR8_ASPNC|nr:uncharacterized protein An05g01160 [Aspergillus niger]CAK39151.1 unnamed protein product [Aspergillus niger]
MARDTYNLVQSRYGDIAKYSLNTQQSKVEDNIARAFGYTAEDLKVLPEKANLALSCGNPVGFANLKEVWLSSLVPRRHKLSPNLLMIELAKKNIQKAGLSNARVIEANINCIPLPDSSVDCIISNCVINLVPAADKERVFKEIARLLKPGGRVAISDILARQPLPNTITQSMALYVGCVAGASQIGTYDEYLRQAGFEGVFIVDTKSDLNLYKQSSYLHQSSCCSGACGFDTTSAIEELDFNEWVGQLLPSIPG